MDETETQRQQRQLEELIRERGLLDRPTFSINRAEHIRFVQSGISGLNSRFVSLDASQPWLCYWMLHALSLLGRSVESFAARAIHTLRQCQSPHGGYGGGFGQLAHLAPSYAAVSALLTAGTVEAYQSIDREAMYMFLMRLKQPDGSFIMHEDGEVDVRGSYCAISIAVLLNICTIELMENVAEFILECQTYEGGIGGYPGGEAHGGYAYCAVATLKLLDKIEIIDRKRLLKWAVRRQMPFEGGFQGRTNKLVDGCYSFWLGALFPILDDEISPAGGGLFDRDRLQQYILACTQTLLGGLTDRPGNSADFYHTCYCLSGLSIAEHYDGFDSSGSKEHSKQTPAIHPLFNLVMAKYEASRRYYYPDCDDHQHAALIIQKDE